MVVLLIVLLMILAAPYVYQQFHEDKVVDFKDLDKDAALLKYTKVGETAGNSTNGTLSDEKIANPQLFVFNPISLDDFGSPFTDLLFHTETGSISYYGS